MLKSDDNLVSSEPAMEKLGPWVIQILRFLDYLAQLLSWVFAAVVFLLYVVYGKAGGFSGGFVALTFMAVAFHLVREATEVWESYPSWIDVERHALEHREVSTPLLVSALILAFGLFFVGRFGQAIFSLLFFIVINKLVVRSCQTKSEEHFRAFRSFFETDSKSADFIKSKDELVVDGSSDFVSGDGPSKEDYFSTVDEAGTVLMRQTRRRVNGREYVRGEALIEFDANSDVAFLNISFCPPFEGVPSFDCEQTDGRETSLNVSLLQSFGVRLEARRTDSTTSPDDKIGTNVKIAFYAAFPPMEND